MKFMKKNQTLHILHALHGKISCYEQDEKELRQLENQIKSRTLQ